MAQNAKAVSYSYKNRLQTPLETAIWWSEYVAATGGAHLTRSHAIDLPWYAYYCLDIWLFVLFVISITIMTWIWLSKRMCRRNKKGNEVKEKRQ